MTKPIPFILSIIQLLLTLETNAECLTEQDLDFESCDLIHLPDAALNGICQRTGLDMEGHVLPALLGMDEDEEAGVGETAERTFTHDDYVKGAETCLEIEDEVNRLEDENPDYLEDLEREALLEDPEIFAEMITQLLSQDETMLKEITTKLAQDNQELMHDAKELLLEGETLEDRPDVLGILLAKYLSEDPGLLDEFDALFDMDEDELDSNHEVKDEL